MSKNYDFLKIFHIVKKRKFNAREKENSPGIQKNKNKLRTNYWYHQQHGNGKP